MNILIEGYSKWSYQAEGIEKDQSGDGDAGISQHNGDVVREDMQLLCVTDEDAEDKDR